MPIYDQMETLGRAEHEAGRSPLADAIERRQGDIEARWLARIREDARAANVELTDLKDGIDQYLRRVAEALRDAGPIENDGRRAWHDVASEHALTRVRIGFDIEQLMHELIVLRKTMVEVLREEGVVPDGEPFERMMSIFDDALTASVKSYVQARDYEGRRQQAEHLGFLAHQVRSPLSAALLALGQVRRKLQGSDECTRALDRAERSLHRAHGLIDQVLMVESLGAGAQRAQPVETTLGTLLMDVVASCRQSAERKGLAFKADYDPQLELRTDPKLVVSALEHLLENGIKYTDRGEVSLRVHQAHGRVEFHVRDSCPGLSDEELRIVFEPFRRGRSNKTGSGLGLAIVRRAVQALGGEVHAESAEERGCHFWFYIPSILH